MPQPTKRLGELLVEGGLIMPAQLQSAITHQKIARGRLGSNLVALGYISEEILMDFLSRQTGVPQMDVRHADVPPQILKLVPHRLADQFTVLPIAVKEPKSLVLAMSDPSDLNAIDSVRFASGLNVEPVVASHSALRNAISTLYPPVESPSGARTVEIGSNPSQAESLPVAFSMPPPPGPPPAPSSQSSLPRDPFFGGPHAPSAQPSSADPFGLFDSAPRSSTAGLPAPPNLVPGQTHAQAVRPLETYQTRSLVLGLIRLFQRRGVIGQDELQHFLANLVEAGEIKDDGKVG